MKFKVIISSILLFLASFIIATTFIYSSSMFVSNIGASLQPDIIAVAGVCIAAVTGFMQYLQRHIKRYEFIYLVHITGFAIVVLAVELLYGFGNILDASKVFFAFGVTVNIMGRLLSWNLVGRYFNVIDSRKYFALFTAFQELGIISAALTIRYFFAYKDFFFITQFLMVLLLLLIGLIVVLVARRLNMISFKHHLSKSKRKYNITKLFIGNPLVSSLALFVVLTLVFEQSLLYELNTVFGEQYKNIGDFNKAFSLYKLCESSFVIFINLFIGKFFHKFFTKSGVLIIYATAVITSLIFLNMSSFWLLVAISSFIRHVSKYTLFVPTYEQVMNTFVTKLRIKLKSVIEGMISPLFIILAGLFLKMFTTVESFRTLNVLLFALAAVMFYTAMNFKKIYLKFHTGNIFSKDLEKVIKSVQSMGEIKNKHAVRPLLKLLKTNPNKFIRRNVIYSLGQIKMPFLRRALYREMENEHEGLQIATVKALSKLNSYEVQSFLIDAINNKLCKSINVKMCILARLYSMMGDTIVPIFLPYLRSEDPRIVADTIEALTVVKDKKLVDLILPYISHDNNRVKANAIMALYKFSKHKKECVRKLSEMLKSDDSGSVSSAVYVVGRLKIKELLKDVRDNVYIDSEETYINRAYALSQLDKKYGYEMFACVFLSKNADIITKSMHHFTQMEPATRLRVLEAYVAKKQGSGSRLIKFLKDSLFEFREERDFLKFYQV